MNPEIKAKWLEALRSGQYKQGQGCLRDTDDRYCCLGVLAKVLSDKQPELGKFVKNKACSIDYSFHDNLVGYYASGTLTESLMKASELFTANPLVKYEKAEKEDKDISLAVLNDEFQLNFLEIADLIEQQL